MGKPAARVGDITSHGGLITGPGCPTVLIGKMPAALTGDMHTCPMVTPGTPPVPHVGGPIVGPVPPTVLIGKKPAACVGDMAICVGVPSTILPPGCPTVLIGQSGGVGAGGSGNSSGSIQSNAKSQGTIESVQGTETFPIELQTLIRDAVTVLPEEQIRFIITEVKDLLSKCEGQTYGEKNKELTIKDFKEILESIENEDGYEAAGSFCAYLDYSRLCMMAESGSEGNDPNQMPTRFMLLPGMDDRKLQKIDEHPDNFPNSPEHKINIINLSKGLKLLGYECKESGYFDDAIKSVFIEYLSERLCEEVKISDNHIVKDYEDLGGIAERHGLQCWKHIYQINKEKIGENPDLLKKETELIIPQWDTTKGDKMITKKGGDPHIYTEGMKYRYPWVPYSFTLVNIDDEILMETNESGEKSTQFNKKKNYEFIDRKTGIVVAEGTISKADELEILAPDVKEVLVRVDGVEYC